MTILHKSDIILLKLYYFKNSIMKTKIMKVIKQISVGFAFATVIMLIVAIVLFNVSGMWLSDVNVAMANEAMWAWRIAIVTFIIAVSTILSSSFTKSA